MRVRIENDILFIDHADLPDYKKGGSVVRNSYFWALKSIACFTSRNKDWEYDQEVWIALERMLIAFTESGYLSDRETSLEFPENIPIPPQLRAVSNYF